MKNVLSAFDITSMSGWQIVIRLCHVISIETKQIQKCLVFTFFLHKSLIDEIDL